MSVVEDEKSEKMAVTVDIQSEKVTTSIFSKEKVPTVTPTTVKNPFLQDSPDKDQENLKKIPPKPTKNAQVPQSDFRDKSSRAKTVEKNQTVRTLQASELKSALLENSDKSERIILDKSFTQYIHQIIGVKTRANQLHSLLRCHGMNLEIRTELQIPVLEEGAVVKQGRQQNITAVLSRHGACPRLCARRGVNLDVLAQHIFDLDISTFRDPVKNPRGTVNRSDYVQIHRSSGVTGYLRLRRDKLRSYLRPI